MPQTGRYRNTRTGKVIKCIQDTRFPPAPRGSFWVQVTWTENAFRSVIDFLTKYAPVLESLAAVIAIMAFVERLIRRSFVLAIILGLVAVACTFAFLVHIVVRGGARTTIRHRIVAALGAFLLVAVVVLAILSGWQKWQYPLFSPATEDEILVVVAEFEDRSVQRDMEIHRLIIDRISSDLAETQIGNVRLEKAPVIKGDDGVESARKIGEKYNAAMIIWGWYDDVGFWSNFRITRPPESPYIDFDVQSSSEVIVPGTPVSFTMAFTVTGGEYLALRDLEMLGEPLLPDTIGLYIVEKIPAQMSYFSLFTVAQIYYSDRQLDQALDLLDVAVQRAQEGGISAQEGEIRNSLALAWFYKGVIYHSVLGNEQEALKAYDQAIDLNPDLDYPYNNRGIIYAHQGQYELALADYNEALRISPEDPEYHANRGEAYVGLRDYRNAIRDFDYALANFLSPILYYRRGNAHKYLGEYEQAIDDLTQAVVLSPEFAWAYNSRGDAYAALGDYDPAFEDFAQAKQLDPQWALPYCNTGNVLLQQGKYEEALAEYDKAVMLAEQYEQPSSSCSSSDSLMYLRRAEMLQQMGNYTRAQDDFETIVRLLEDFNRALELTPESAEVYHALGIAHQALGEYDLAINDFSKAIEASPDDPALYVMRATAYSDSSDNEAALQDLTEALDLDPESWEAHYASGVVHTRLGEYRKALVDFRKSLEFNPDSTNTYLEYGKVCMLVGEYEEAIASFTKALEIAPALADAYQSRGEAYEELGKPDDAIADFKKFRDLTDDGYWRDWAERKIDELRTRHRQ